jgi:hypothetical protein
VDRRALAGGLVRATASFSTLLQYRSRHEGCKWSGLVHMLTTLGICGKGGIPRQPPRSLVPRRDLDCRRHRQFFLTSYPRMHPRRTFFAATTKSSRCVPLRSHFLCLLPSLINREAQSRGMEGREVWRCIECTDVSDFKIVPCDSVLRAHVDVRVVQKWILKKTGWKDFFEASRDGGRRSSS